MVTSNQTLPGMALPGNFFLVGLMGAGKTTIGRALARLCDKRFIDSDHEIEARTGVRIPVIFDIEGEQGFREREAEVIHELCRQHDIVLATGGGAVLAESNRRNLKAHGWVIYLHASPEELHERTRLDRNRPLLQTGDPLGKLNELYQQRDPLYREIADLVVDTSRQSASALAQTLIRTLAHQYANRTRQP